MNAKDIKANICCPSCGHEQVVSLEWSVFSDELASVNYVLNGVKTAAINGGFECVCGRKVTAVLLINSIEKNGNGK